MIKINFPTFVPRYIYIAIELSVDVTPELGNQDLFII